MSVQEQVETKIDSDESKNEEGSTLTLEQALAEIEKLKSIKNDIVKERDNYKHKARDLDKIVNQFKDLNIDDPSKFKNDLDQSLNRIVELETKYKESSAKSVLEKLLNESKVNPGALNTAMDLIKLDSFKYKNDEVVVESVADAIADLKSKHPILFNEVVQAPAPARPEDKPTTATYETELQSLLKRGVNQKELTALKKKYGRN